MILIEKLYITLFEILFLSLQDAIIQIRKPSTTMLVIKLNKPIINFNTKADMFKYSHFPSLFM